MDMKETIAKAAGKLKKAGAMLSGDVGIFKRLKEEHGQVSGLMMQIKTGGEDTRRQLFPKLRRELTAHARAEELEVYPVFSRYDEVRTLTVAISQDHKDMERLFTQLESIPIASDEWKQTFEQLMRTVQEHVDREENELFPRAEDVISDEGAQEIDRRFVEARTREEQKFDARPTIITDVGVQPTTHT